MAFIAQDTACPPERIERISDPASGLEGVIVLHSTRLGPAAGGCRLRDYPDENAMIADALRLAEGMSYKNALADLPFGGGIISVAGEYLGWSENEVMRRVDAIPDRLCELLRSANVAGACHPGLSARIGADWAELRVRGDASPQLLMRILGLLAQQDRMPDRATIDKVDETLEVVIAIGALPRHQAEVVAEKIRSMVGTHSVRLAWHASPHENRKPSRPLCRFASGLHGDRAGIA